MLCNALYVTLLVVLLSENVLSFALNMGGGRSPAEQGVTKKGMFKELRKKLNTAAEAPGFFDTSGRVDIDLICGSNKDGTQIGDDPFSQFVSMVLLKKGISYNVRPTLITSANKMEVPKLVTPEKTLTNAMEIAEYIEQKYPHSTLTRQGAFSYQEVLEKTAGLMPALTAYLVNKDMAKDAALLGSVSAQLDTLDEVIRSTPGKFICGLDMTLADLYLLPQLFHAVVAMSHFKGEEIMHLGCDPTRPALENWLGRMMDSEEFNDKRCYYNADAVIYGWKKQRGEA